MTRKQFTFYESYYEAITALPKKVQTDVVLAICAYALRDEEPKLTGTAAAVFSLIRPTLDAAQRKAENGRRGGKQSASKAEAKGKQSASEKEDEKEDEKEVEVENECYIGADAPALTIPPVVSAPSARFKKPTVEEVRAYCIERCNNVDPQRFVDHYTANGWKVGGKSPMKDWKAAVRTWEHNGVGAGRPVQAASRTGFESGNPFLEMLAEERGL